MELGHVREDPEGGVPRRAAAASLPVRYAHRSGEKRRRRPGRAAAAGGWYPRVSLGDGGAPRVNLQCGEKCAGGGQDRALFLCEKKAG
jgi:hypothetical protein